jgi:hypothetical protein
MSKLETNTIDTISGSTNLTLGGTNATDITIPSGVTITNNGTQSGFGGVNTPIVSARLSSDTNVTDATWTKIQFNTEEIDTNSAYDNTTNYRFTVPSGQAGKYLVTGQLLGNGNNNDINTVAIRIYKNGTGDQARGIQFQNPTTSRGQGTTVTVTQILDLSVSDYIELWGFIDVDSGTPYFQSSDLGTRITICKMIE